MNTTTSIPDPVKPVNVTATEVAEALGNMYGIPTVTVEKTDAQPKSHRDGDEWVTPFGQVVIVPELRRIAGFGFTKTGLDFIRHSVNRVRYENHLDHIEYWTRDTTPEGHTRYYGWLVTRESFTVCDLPECDDYGTERLGEAHVHEQTGAIFGDYAAKVFYEEGHGWRVDAYIGVEPYLDPVNARDHARAVLAAADLAEQLNGGETPSVVVDARFSGGHLEVDTTEYLEHKLVQLTAPFGQLDLFPHEADALAVALNRASVEAVNEGRTVRRLVDECAEPQHDGIGGGL